MTPHEFHQHVVNYFDTHYELVRDLSFAQERPQRLSDHANAADRSCRFCQGREPEVTFKQVAHAAPELLGNRSLISMNECDSCNGFFGGGGGHEDHLGKWSGLARAIAQIPKKSSGKPKFKSNDGTFRVETIDDRLHIHLPTGSVDEFLANGIPTKMDIEGDTRSQPYVPIRAAMALVKIACSLCPMEDLGQCRAAIKWILGLKTTRIAPLPVLYAYTPAVSGDAMNGVKLLRRKGDGPEPYLWCVVQFRGFRLQAFVPFCPADRHWFREDQACTFTLTHYPSPFPPDLLAEPTVYGILDWSGTKLVRTTVAASFHIEGIIGIARPGKPSGSAAE